MGIGRSDLRDMSLWEFQARMNAYVDANTPDSKRGLDDQEIAELSELIDDAS